MIFLPYSINKKEKALHRSLWPKRKTTPLQAANYVNRLVEDQIRSVETPKILDLGCGLGNSMFYLAEGLQEAQISGITNQGNFRVYLSQELQNRILTSRLKVYEGDFSDPKVFRTFPGCHLIYSIESIFYNDNIEGVLNGVASSLAPGGKFIIIDDFLNPQKNDRNQAKYLNDYRKINPLYGLTAVESLEDKAKKVKLNLVVNQELTPYIKHSVLDKLTDLILIPILKKNYTDSAFVSKQKGKYAWRSMIQNNYLHYRMLVFQKK